MALKKEQAYLDQLNTLAGDITKRILTPEYAHMVELWKAFLGGFIGPEIAKLSPESIDDKRKSLMERYSKVAIEKMLNPEPKQVEVEKIVEKVVYKDRPVPAGNAPAPAHPDNSGHRRYRPRVNKVSRKKREMKAEERRSVIQLFNSAQVLMDKEDKRCSDLVDHLNNNLQPGESPTYPSQVAGYWSWLCRLVLMPEDNQNKWYKSAIKLGKIPEGCPMPQASDQFKSLIIENQQKEKSLAAHRQAYRSHMQNKNAPTQINKPSSISF